MQALSCTLKDQRVKRQVLASFHLVAIQLHLLNSPTSPLIHQSVTGDPRGRVQSTVQLVLSDLEFNDLTTTNQRVIDPRPRTHSIRSVFAELIANSIQTEAVRILKYRSAVSRQCS